ncbi:MAG: NAD(P)H-hydrate dehydratase [Rhodothermales bacterium]|nr:NAD(P)H-hydrate dehydratase [Rhodothermales bacterium]
MPYLDLLPSAAAMRAADATAMAAGLTAFALMENAGRAAAQHLLASLLPEHTVLVACGRGGNGGDGFAMARALAEAGVYVEVWMAHPPDALRDDARQHYDLLQRLAPDLPGYLAFVTEETMGADFTYGVDALLGTGQTGPLRPPEAHGAALLRSRASLLVALDVPTGLDADTGVAADGAVTALETLTFAAEKPGLRLHDGPAHAGVVTVLPIGLPAPLLERMLAAHGGAFASTDDWARAVQPRRAADAHKFSAGTALVVAGSDAYLGAPRLAAAAAARSGAGYVRLVTAADAVPLVAPSMLDIPTTAWPLAPDGGLDPTAIETTVREMLRKTNALVVGPGLGRAASTQEAVRRLLLAFDGPAVIDADALAAVTPDFLHDHASGRWVVTPHAGELARLVGTDRVDLTDRVAVARDLAARWNAVVVLKGLPSVVAEPPSKDQPGRVAVSTPHSPALATAGTGDVLAGMIGGFLAQGLSPFDAALLALHTGGRAALRYARRRAETSMQASDLLRLVPRLLAR